MAGLLDFLNYDPSNYAGNGGAVGLISADALKRFADFDLSQNERFQTSPGEQTMLLSGLGGGIPSYNPIGAAAPASPFDGAQAYMPPQIPLPRSPFDLAAMQGVTAQPTQSPSPQSPISVWDNAQPYTATLPQQQQPGFGSVPDYGQQRNIQIGNYTMPQFGSPPDDKALPHGAQPAQYQAPQQQPISTRVNPDPSSDFGTRLTAGLQGFVNGGSPLQALGNLIGGLATGQRSDPAGVALENQRAAFQALRPILGDSKAMLAVMNPEAGKILLEQALSSKEKFGVVGEDQFGGKQYGFINEREQTVNGSPINATSNGAGATGGGAGYLAKGVTNYDPTLPGDQYLQQFSPDVQAAIRAFARGDSQPTSNARKGWAENIIKFAKTWGEKTGQNVNDQTFYEKKKLKTELGASGNSTIGGILDNGESSFKHLAELGQSFAGLGSHSLNGVPFGGYIANGINGVGSAAAGSDMRGKINAAKVNLARYGQEATKFYAGSGGGVEERMAALKAVPPETSSGEEQAAYLEKEKSLMLDRLEQKFNHIRQTLGEDEGNQIIAKKMPTIERSIAAIDASIAKLRGTGNASVGAPSVPASAVKPGVTNNGVRWSVQ